MAHENLRFNVLLSEDNSTLAEPLQYSPIFSDTKYGTHYGLFANFRGSKTNNRTFRIAQIELLLQNYTGGISIGISHILGIHINERPPQRYLEKHQKGKWVQLFVCLQGLSAHYGKKLDLADAELELTEGDILEVVAVFEPVSNAYSKIDEPLERRNAETLFADPDYLERDGEDIRLLVPKIAFREELQRLIERGFKVTTESTHDFKKEFSTIGDDKFCRMKVSNVVIA